MKARIPNQDGGAANMNQLIRQAQKLQAETEALKADLDAREYDVAAGGGMVKLKINGKKEVLSLEISPEIVDPDDVETLSDVILAAVNQAVRLVEDTNEKELSKVAGGLSVPGMF
ncbi:MAG: YbaB/EbfC family nucleoid-associated protein [Clostridia bacterium]|nr:YbaB/EbfC family nucleoid-associated protein [Clostridia bacterium]